MLIFGDRMYSTIAVKKSRVEESSQETTKSIGKPGEPARRIAGSIPVDLGPCFFKKEPKESKCSLAFPHQFCTCKTHNMCLHVPVDLA